ncbi:EamA family transporter [Clostridium aquiflavi]|uniref:EamA family transporter n=1 Tax=Clostridium aquiflavi TaxID=3073603 RepID=A0ABU1EJ50_9CLOT|nr:EamA family transporter [Clostridium sp. 5N-1]MDR5588253.1 EamA family transporter [Clostridium sp. 5N-1]
MIKIICYITIIIMTIFGAFAGLFLKRASSSKKLKELILNINLYIGGILYIISALMNIYVLKYLDYSITLPLTSITYIWTMIISYIILKEKITYKKIFGIICICSGAILITIN